MGMVVRVSDTDERASDRPRYRLAGWAAVVAACAFLVQPLSVGFLPFDLEAMRDPVALSTYWWAGMLQAVEFAVMAVAVLMLVVELQVGWRASPWLRVAWGLGVVSGAGVPPAVSVERGDIFMVVDAGRVVVLTRPGDPQRDPAAEQHAPSVLASLNCAGVRRWSMSDIKVRLLNDDEWQLFREVRLAALRDAPEAFVASVEDEESRSEGYWRERMSRARRIIAEREDGPVGVVCLGLHDGDSETGEVFGLWTAPTVRGARVAWGLVSTAAQKAAEDGCRLLYFWAGSDNASAVGFASSFGFRPTAERRPVRVADGATEKDADEVAMVLPLTADPTQTKNPYVT